MIDLNELASLGGPNGLLELVVRVAILYVVILVSVRLSGKRGIGQAGAADFILALAVGDVIGDAAYGTENVLTAIAIVAIWVGLHALTAFLGIRWPRFGELVEGKRVVVIRDGVIIDTALKQELMNRNELKMLLRGKGVEDPSMVKAAFLETDGTLSVFMKKGQNNI
ncbi:MAG TPA: DUF421 domain-containing protein [Methanomassiliicoccaceae archaeon]|jgi:uncharacterized membrane protein YcaP (DUF421 family)|nr:DUF421 domain-containing protein [Euryarchaeota archaeon]HOB38277.1 DUF421 domain-containing protein [Methanomassiliicoccaceae archaeon]HQA20718.1 DUF421 domain-containing protein [Methanomassiliicoccaceae archaeon]HQD88095.1 DUF421 domain-containing protein [Methanomassiliicoccaceae archaeon]